MHQDSQKQPKIAPKDLREPLDLYIGPCGHLSGPISRDIAVVSLRCPLSRDTFSAIPAIPQQGAIPPLAAFFYTDISVRYPILQHIARYLCDTPRKQARKSFAILSLKVSRNMKSIAAGPLRWALFQTKVNTEKGLRMSSRGLRGPWVRKEKPPSALAPDISWLLKPRKFKARKKLLKSDRPGPSQSGQQGSKKNN